MTKLEIIALIATCIGVICFALVIIILYRNYINKAISETESGIRDIELIDTIIYENDPKTKRRNKAVSISKNVVYYVFLVLAIPFLCFGIYSRFTNGVVMFGDSSAMVVASGSMSNKNVSNGYLFDNNLDNQFQTFDMIVLKKVDELYIKKYDVIAYRNDKKVNIIHRIVSIDKIDGVTRYTTRGDANNSNDSYKPSYEDIIGKYSNRRIPTIGIFISFFQSYSGIVTIISIIVCLYFIDRDNKKLIFAEDDRKELLQTVFDVTSMDENTYQDMMSNTETKIYYKGYCYKFAEKEFISKDEMSKEEKEAFDKENEATKITQDDKGEHKFKFSLFKRNKMINDLGGKEDEQE